MGASERIYKGKYIPIWVKIENIEYLILDEVANLSCEASYAESFSHCQEAGQTLLLYAHFSIVDELQDPHQVWMTYVSGKRSDAAAFPWQEDTT